jgi:hypothetical protein
MRVLGQPSRDDLATREFKLFQETVGEAHRWRDVKGRSSVTREMIEIERSWRRDMIVQASSVSARLARALNDGGSFSREVYSKHQNAWPQRSMKSAPSCLENDEYITLFREDVELVLGKTRSIIDGPASSGLTEDVRQKCSNIAALPADEVALSDLMALLTRLQGELDGPPNG